MGEGDSLRHKRCAQDQEGIAPLPTLRLVQGDEADPAERRMIAVRGVRRSLGRLLRALPVADWNASAFPDVVVTQLAQYDSVTAAYLWGSEGVEDEALDDAIAGMNAIERWVRSSLSARASAAVRKQELQVFIPDQELRDPLVLSEWSGAFVCHEDAEAMSELHEDLESAIAGLGGERLLVVAQRLGVVSPVDWSREAHERRAALEQAISRCLRDPERLCVLVSTLSDAARGLLSQLAGGCCDERCLRRWAQFYMAEPTFGAAGRGDGGRTLGHPVQLLRDCGLVFLDSACRLSVPEALVSPLRGVFATLRELDCNARAAQ